MAPEIDLTCLPVVKEPEHMASEKPFCIRDPVAIAVKEIPECGEVWFGETITNLEEKQITNDLETFH